MKQYKSQEENTKYMSKIKDDFFVEDIENAYSEEFHTRFEMELCGWDSRFDPIYLKLYLNHKDKYYNGIGNFIQRAARIIERIFRDKEPLRKWNADKTEVIET